MYFVAVFIPCFGGFIQNKNHDVIKNNFTNTMLFKINFTHVYENKEVLDLSKKYSMIINIIF